MSQKSLKEALNAWKQSCEKPASTPLPQRFYDVRKRPTGIPRYSTGGITPEGEAVMARDLGLDMRNAKPIDETKLANFPNGDRDV